MSDNIIKNIRRGTLRTIAPLKLKVKNGVVEFSSIDDYDAFYDKIREVSEGFELSDSFSYDPEMVNNEEFDMYPDVFLVIMCILEQKLENKTDEKSKTFYNAVYTWINKHIYTVEE